MKVTKAVIPAAGLGTRVLPISKALPKEMLNIVDKPAIQYIVEEAVAAGITDILIITSRGKAVMEDHFDKAIELYERLERKNDPEMLETLQKIDDLANIHFIRQHEPLGLGHAVLCAKAFVGDDPFAVLYGDDVIVGEVPAIGELMEAYERYGQGVLGIKEVSAGDIGKYSSLKVEKIDGNCFQVTDMIEKPAPNQVLSLYSILGRCVLPSRIFEELERTEPGAGGEIQLTDAMYELMRCQGMIGVEFSGKRYDMGSKFGILQANIEVGLQHEETGPQLRAYLKEMAETLE
jgi:UTP--glucose-1-phosphate uridylyltransferase